MWRETGSPKYKDGRNCSRRKKAKKSGGLGWVRVSGAGERLCHLLSASEPVSFLSVAIFLFILTGCCPQSSYSLSCVVVKGGAGEELRKETVSVFARLLVLVLGSWQALGPKWPRNCLPCLQLVEAQGCWSLCQLEPRAQRKIGPNPASYLAAWCTCHCHKCRCVRGNILDNGQFQELQEGLS